jgi:hypothetical protein
MAMLAEMAVRPQRPVSRTRRAAGGNAPRLAARGAGGPPRLPVALVIPARSPPA